MVSNIDTFRIILEASEMNGGPRVGSPSLEQPWRTVTSKCGSAPKGASAFKPLHNPSTPAVEDIETELAAELVVRCEIGLGGGQ